MHFRIKIHTHTYPTIFNLPPLSIAFYNLKGKKRLQIQVIFFLTKDPSSDFFNHIFSEKFMIHIQSLKFYTNIFQKFCQDDFF